MLSQKLGENWEKTGLHAKVIGGLHINYTCTKQNVNIRATIKTVSACREPKGEIK